MMDPKCEMPAYKFSVGDRNEFAIEAILPAFKDAQPLRLSLPLSLTDGYFTFFVGGLNVFQVDSIPNLNETLRDYSTISLSMVLEWIYFDKAYALDNGVTTFAEIVDGESSPDLRFQLFEHDVQIEWDLKDWKRVGSQYSNPEGRGRISYLSYLTSLALTADTIIAVTERRASCIGRVSEWRQWLSGHKAERDTFQEFVRTVLYESSDGMKTGETETGTTSTETGTT